MSPATPRISVLLVSYNHAPYIAQAIDGILSQQTPEPFEIILADDASTDGTTHIAAARLATRPDIPHHILPAERNLGTVRNYQRAFAACRTDLVATLEGDDHWTSPGKLAAQAAILDANPACPLCATNFHFDEPGNTHTRLEVSNRISMLAARDLVLDNRPGNISCCMYRQSALAALPTGFWDHLVGDWILNICAAQAGPLALTHQPMSVYRRNDGGIWNSLTKPQQFQLLLDLIPTYDALTRHAYHHEFAHVAAGFQRDLQAGPP